MLLRDSGHMTFVEQTQEYLKTVRGFMLGEMKLSASA
jgi:hypothetical protein